MLGKSIEFISSNEKSQNFLDFTDSVVWFLAKVFPRMLPIHTSNPLSDRMNAKLPKILRISNPKLLEIVQINNIKDIVNLQKTVDTSPNMAKFIFYCLP